MTTHQIPTTDGTIVTYHGPRHGEGRPLVLLHGLSANASSWEPVIDRVGSQWRTFALDFRGHGRSGHTPGGYRFDDYRGDAISLLDAIGEPAVLVGHSLGAIVAASLAQERHPLVTAVFLEDPPLYSLEPEVFATTSFARVFPILADHVTRLQAGRAPIEAYRDLIAAAPHPAGDTQGDHLHADAVWARAVALAAMDPDAFGAVLDGRTFAGYRPDRPIDCPATVVRADPACDAAFLPADADRLQAQSPHVEVVEMPGAGHNIRGDRATRDRYLDVLETFLARQPATVAARGV